MRSRRVLRIVCRACNYTVERPAPASLDHKSLRGRQSRCPKCGERKGTPSLITERIPCLEDFSADDIALLQRAREVMEQQERDRVLLIRSEYLAERYMRLAGLLHDLHREVKSRKGWK